MLLSGEGGVTLLVKPGTSMLNGGNEFVTRILKKADREPELRAKLGEGGKGQKVHNGPVGK